MCGAPLVVALEAPGGQQDTAPGPHTDRAVRGPRLHAGAPAVLGDQPGDPVFRADVRAAGTGGGQQQAPDQCAARAQRPVGVSQARAVPVDGGADQGQQVAQLVRCQVERDEGAARVHPAGGGDVVGEGTPLEHEGRVAFEPGDQCGGVPQEGLTAFGLGVAGEGAQVGAGRLGGVAEARPFLDLGAGQPAGGP